MKSLLMNAEGEEQARNITRYNQLLRYGPVLDLLDELEDGQIADMILSLRNAGQELPETITDINRAVAILRAALKRDEANEETQELT